MILQQLKHFPLVKVRIHSNMLRKSKQEKLSSFALAVKPMKAFTHGFTDSVSPDNGSNSPFFVNGECESYLSFFTKKFRFLLVSHLSLAAWAKFYGSEYDVLLVDWSPLALGNSYSLAFLYYSYLMKIAC